MDESRLDRDKLRVRLREAKQRLQDDPEFLARFDEDGDGIVDGAEWEAVRAWVIEELEKESIEQDVPGTRSPHGAEGAPQMYGDPEPPPLFTDEEAAERVGRPIIIDGPFDEDHQAGPLMVRAAVALLAAFVLPVMHFSVSAPGASRSETLWSWELTGGATLYAFFPILAGLGLAVLAARSELDRGLVVKIGGAIGVAGLLTMIFAPGGADMSGAGQASASFDSFGKLLVLLLFGAVAMAVGAHHRLRHEATVYGRGLLVLGALCVAVALFAPQELSPIGQLSQLQEAARGGAASSSGDATSSTLKHVWELFGAWLDIPSDLRSPIGTLGLFTVALSCSLFLITALVAVFSVFTEQEPERAELLARGIRIAAISFAMIATLGSFLAMYGLGGVIERILESMGAPDSLSVSIYATGFLSIGLATSAYIYVTTQGVSRALDRFEP